MASSAIKSEVEIYVYRLVKCEGLRQQRLTVLQMAGNQFFLQLA
jgi:hypothetical protein